MNFAIRGKIVSAFVFAVLLLILLATFGSGSMAVTQAQAPDGTPTPGPFQPLPPNQPDKGLIYDGLKVESSGLCAGFFSVGNTGLCTHGPDPISIGGLAAPNGPSLPDANV